MTLHKKELSVFGNKFVKILNDNGLAASFDDSSFRDYLLQISVKNKLVNLGKINVYYKPSKKSFSLFAYSRVFSINLSNSLSKLL